MKRVRLAAYAALAGLGLFSGCQSCGDPCRPSFFSRVFRPRSSTITTCEPPTCAGGCSGTPVSGGPVYGGDVPITSHGGPEIYDGGPELPHAGIVGEPIGSPGYGIQPPAFNGRSTMPPYAPPTQPFPLPSNGAPPDVPSVLPSPTPLEGAPRFAPVPNGGSFANPTPANPSSRKRN